MTGYTYHDDAGGALGKLLGIPFPNETNDYNIPNTEWFSRWMGTYSFYENTVEIVDVSNYQSITICVYSMGYHSNAISYVWYVNT